MHHGDIFLVKSIIAVFQMEVKSIQHTACLALTGAIRGTSNGKSYEKLDLE